MSLYDGWVMDHGKNPRNSLLLEDATHQARADNPFCGDRITVSLRIEAGVVQACTAKARACAICIASGSLLTELLPGTPTADVPQLVEAARTAVLADHPEPAPPLQHLAALRGTPSRKKCATLPFEALAQALESP